MNALIPDFSVASKLKKLEQLVDTIEEHRQEIFNFWESLPNDQQDLPEVHLPLRKMLVELLLGSRKLEREIKELRKNKYV